MIWLSWTQDPSKSTRTEDKTGSRQEVMQAVRGHSEKVEHIRAPD